MNESSQRSRYSSIEKRTKEIYIAQHRNYSRDKSIFNRFLDVASDPATYDVPSNYFAGKIVLDAGCGNTGYFQVAMRALGALHVTCLDLGKDWISELSSVTDAHFLPREFLDYVDGSTTNLPFGDNSFDFVASNGVIMHLETEVDAAEAIREMGRVTKPGGSMYVYSGVDKPGIVDNYIVPALRRAYAEDRDFRRFVDELDHRRVAEELKVSFAEARKYDKSLPKAIIGSIDRLITLDTTTFLQNLLQVPVQQGPRLGWEWVSGQLKALGFVNIRRVQERYWVRNDVRKFLAPLHYFRQRELAGLLYGGGHVRVMADKPA